MKIPPGWAGKGGSVRQLTIDPEFRDKIPPLSEDEFSKLEGNIVADGEVREPLVVWHNTIRDAQADRTSGARKYAVQILLAYNYGQREENRLPNLL